MEQAEQGQEEALFAAFDLEGSSANHSLGPLVNQRRVEREDGMKRRTNQPALEGELLGGEVLWEEGRETLGEKGLELLLESSLVVFHPETEESILEFGKVALAPAERERENRMKRLESALQRRAGGSCGVVPESSSIEMIAVGEKLKELLKSRRARGGGLEGEEEGELEVGLG